MVQQRLREGAKKAKDKEREVIIYFLPQLKFSKISLFKFSLIINYNIKIVLIEI